MSLLCLPWTVINLGAEMLYVLDQRLRAQSVAPDRAARVVLDIVLTLFDRAFLGKLFAPQAPYSVKDTRTLCDRLAHSSAMRLNESSMDKLFDLMVMGVKYQLMACTTLDGMLQVLLRHLAGVRAIVLSHAGPSGDPARVTQAIDRLEQAEAAAVGFYSCLGLGQLALLRQTLAAFFQDRRVKVSLLMAEGIQGPGGRLIAPSCVRDSVGMVTSYGHDGRPEHEERLPLAAMQTNAAEFFCHPEPLGANLYDTARAKVVPPPREADGRPQQDQAGSAAEAPQPEQPSTSAAARAELDLLAHLLPGGSGGKAAADNFKLNLFGDGGEDLFGPEGDPFGTGIKSEPPGASGRTAASVSEWGVPAGRGSDSYKRSSGIAAMLQGLDLEGEEGDGPSLLDLMDSAADADGEGG